MIEIECLICGESVKTRDVMKAVAFDKEHAAMHPAPANAEETDRG